MKKVLNSPIFWGVSVLLVVMFISLTKTDLPQVQYGNPNA